jgi:hypothetical protein
MSSLHVPPQNRKWVFEKLAALMWRTDVYGVRLELGGPGGNASIFWYCR